MWRSFKMLIKTKVNTRTPIVQLSSYQEAEQKFSWLLTLENLNEQVKKYPYLGLAE
jgi:hypothetical protein